MVTAFDWASSPRILFGNGTLAALPEVLAAHGPDVLLVKGGGSLDRHGRWPRTRQAMEEAGIRLHPYVVEREPSPELIDAGVARYRTQSIQAVLAVGGGSVLDAGKALAAMLVHPKPVRTYLEGVGEEPPQGHRLPLIAVPTTAGTGSEATKNAVLSEVGPGGFKKSLRHHAFVPDLALVDPELTYTCPPSVTASSGMDAFTQLLEAYLSTHASPMTDALALEGLKQVERGLKRAYEDGKDAQARSAMAYAALLSGLCLANAGLGLVHGFASSIGGRFDVPHGALCGSLMGSANLVSLRMLLRTDPASLALRKYARVGRLFSNRSGQRDTYYAAFLVEWIERWVEEFQLPRLSDMGIPRHALDELASRTSPKNHPVSLPQEAVLEVLERRH